MWFLCFSVICCLVRIVHCKIFCQVKWRCTPLLVISLSGWTHTVDIHGLAISGYNILKSIWILEVVMYLTLLITSKQINFSYHLRFFLSVKTLLALLLCRFSWLYINYNDEPLLIYLKLCSSSLVLCMSFMRCVLIRLFKDYILLTCDVKGLLCTCWSCCEQLLLYQDTAAMIIAILVCNFVSLMLELE